MPDVYDDEKTGAGAHDDLGVHPERREAEVGDLEKQYAAPSAASGNILNQEHQAAKGSPHIQRGGLGVPRTNTPTKPSIERGGLGGTGAALKNQEQGGANQFGFHPEGGKGKGGKKGLRARWKNLKRKSKIRIAAMGAGSVGIVFIILAIALIAGSLIIPNFASSITSYQMARVTRESVATESVETAQKIALDSASDSVWSKAKAKFQNLRNNTWGKFDQYRPQKIQENLEATDQLSYHYGPPSAILHRSRMDQISIGGQEIDIPENAVSTLGKLTSPIDYIKGAIKTRVSIFQAVSDTLHDSNFVVRALVTKNIIAKLDGHLFRWTTDEEKQAQGETEEDGDVANAQESVKISSDSGAAATEAAEGTTTSEISDTTDAAAKAQQAAYTNTAATAEALANGGGLAPGAIAAIGAGLSSSLFTKIVNIVSPTGAIFIPICMILAGSADNSGPQMDAASGEAERSYIGLQSGADQQKAGAVNGEVVGAAGRQLGYVGQSNAQQRAGGVPINTNNTPGAQQPVGGYQPDLLTTLLPAGLATAIETPLKPACNVATNPAFGAAIAVITLLPGIGQGIGAAEDVTVTAVGKIVATELGNVVRNLFTKKGLTKLTVATVATVGAAELAHLIVISHTASTDDGSAQGVTYDNQVDMGGNLFANEVDRQQNYGAPMTDQQVGLLTSADQGFRKQETQSQSVFQRYFAITNPGSLANTVAVDIGTHANLQGFSSLLSSLPRMINPVSLLSRVADLLQPVRKATAAADVDTSDYGDVQWGWNPAEEDVYENNPDYQPLINQYDLDQSGQEDAIAAKYSKCFDGSTTQGTLLAEGDIVRGDNGDIVTNQGLCAPDNLGFTSEDTSGNPIFPNSTAALVYRYRVAMRNDNGLNEVLNQQNVTP